MLRRPQKYCWIIAAAMLAAWGLTACARQVSMPSESAPARSTPPHIEPGLPAIEYTIQVGAFTSAGRAAGLSQRLRSAGLDAYYFIDADQFYKVRFARFETKSTARRNARQLQARGLISDFYIVSPTAKTHQSRSVASLRKKLVQTARQFIGTPYRWGGASAKTGFDCSGLTMTVYRLNGLQLPRNARSQFKAGRAISKQALQTGDLVFFATGRKDRVSHVGIFVGQGNFVHAPGRGKRIRKASLTNAYFKGRYQGARRYF